MGLRQICHYLLPNWPNCFLIIFLLLLQGLLQNIQLIFDTSIEDVLRKKGCQRSQSSKAFYLINTVQLTLKIRNINGDVLS